MEEFEKIADALLADGYIISFHRYPAYWQGYIYSEDKHRSGIAYEQTALDALVHARDNVQPIAPHKYANESRPLVSAKRGKITLDDL